ncbi:MAG: type II secretion system protein [Microgenomates group bacterium]
MKKNGFTLIELLVTMGIIAVLTGMAIFNFNQARARARDVQRKSDLSQLQKALELYRNDNNGKYPVTLSTADQTTYLINEGYSTVVFVDPKGSSWANYVYTATNSNLSYGITACLENSADSTKLVPVVACGGTTNTGVIYQVNNQ